MMKLKEIESRLGSSAWRDEETRQYLYVKCCAIGNNFYDYGEPEPEDWDYSDAPYVKGDRRVKIIGCGDCCNCAGW